MLFPGSTQTAGRTHAALGGTVTAIAGGFGYNSSGRLVFNTDDAPQSFIKGIGVRTDGAVCATTSTDDSDTYIEGVRVTAAGKLVYAEGAVQHFTSGNGCRTTGALAALVPF